jgi:gluconate 5-dehydrogenase
MTDWLGLRDRAALVAGVSSVSGLILFLCSAQSAFVTGHVMYADGGRTLV